MNRWILVSLIVCSLGLASACDDHDQDESFDSLTDCVVDHASLGEPEAIAHCLVDFAELHPDFADQAACVAWVGENGGYADSRDEACTTYFEETGA